MDANTEKIERYLLGEMNPEEMQGFEKELLFDKELKKEFEAQQAVFEGLNRLGLKAEIAKIIQSIRLVKALTLASIIIAIALSVGIGVYLLSNSHTEEQSTHFEVEEVGRPKEIQVPIDSQFISSKWDTIIESPGGLMLAIPAGAFVTGKEQVRIEVKEALTEIDIIKSGLSTTSDGELLQSDGMFSVRAFDGETELVWRKTVTMIVPTKEVNKNMMLFDGEVLDDGTVNWVNPKRIDYDLNTLPMSQLDFYPESFILTLKSLGEDTKNKRFTDSLYYSFSGYVLPTMQMQIKSDRGGFGLITIPGDDLLQKLDSPFEDTVTGIARTETAPPLHNYEIDPSLIKSIWNADFNSTLLATKEFEERLRFIHSTCEPKFLNAYVKHLDWKLWEIDSLCMTLASGAAKKKFQKFYARKDGGVKLNSELVQKLNARFKAKQEAWKTAQAQVWKAHYKELDSLRNLALKKNKDFTIADILRDSVVFADELCRNLKDAYQQIGVLKKCNEPLATAYSISLNTPGWKNLDQYVFAATKDRESMKYTDPVSGKVAILTYTPVSFSIEKEAEYDRILFYLIPDSLSSFQRVYKKEGSWTEKLNSNLNYQFVAVAYKGEELFWTKISNLKPESYAIKFERGTEKEIEAYLQARPHAKANEMKEELAYRRFEIEESIRVQKVRNKEAWRRKIALSIFPCATNQEQLDDAVSYPVQAPSSENIGGE